MPDAAKKEEVSLDLKRQYAWDWFSHHANQRFTAFNFFLVALGAVTVAYASAVASHSIPLGVGISTLSAVVSVAFLAIDVRNAQIVEIARSELEKLEDVLGLPITKTANQKRRLVLSHRFWFRAMLITTTIASVAAAIWAATSFGRGAHRSATDNKAPAHRHS